MSLGKSMICVIGVCASLVSAASAMDMETVPVGNPGNAPDNTGYGAVDYEYKIGKYEVTAGQYTEFLNAVGSTDTYGLYNTSMIVSGHSGCGIGRTGLEGSYNYQAGDPDRPVSYVSWGDAARFANWLHNGQPKGQQNELTTERGSYRLDGAVTTADLMTIARASNVTWALPTENEWYKAGY